MSQMNINGRLIGDNHPPFVIAEVGINHNGSYDKAIEMIDAAVEAGCECIKFQCHIVEDEMVPNDVVPKNADESIFDIISKCTLTEDEEISLKKYCDKKGIIYLSTPFSRQAADRLNGFDVPAFKIGSGECNNYPLIEHIARFGKPIILSTGMNNIDSINKAVKILEKHNVPYSLLHCTSVYPTPYNLVRLGALNDLKSNFPNAILGLSDHTDSIYPCLGAVPLGARVLEKHYTVDKSWDGPDIQVSMDTPELASLITGSKVIFQSLGGRKDILAEEKPTIDFAYACVVATETIPKGSILNEGNTWVKRPGTGDILAEDYHKVLNKKASKTIKKDEQISWNSLV